ncbi:MAG TPA: N-acetylmuramoyl-L-alanine amidase [Longimicrobium sp.]|jgi:N-acetyl-anhydromuramyl-L-alanine amidase AmpD
MQISRKFALAAGALAFLAACSDQPTGARGPEPDAAPTQSLDAAFEKAGRDFGVPAALLKSVGYVETRWQMVRGESEFEGQEPAFGIMALRGARLEEGARLAGVTPEAARTQPEANIRAAAALMSSWSDGIERADVGAWAPVVARFSGIKDPQGQAMYVHNDVYSVLRTGATGGNLGGVTLRSSEAKPRFPAPTGPRLAVAPDYPVAGTIWRPSPNYSTRSTGIHYVIIHTCESGYSGCWSWLTNSTSQVSAHYVVNESGSEISQLVREASKAWHIGANYDCANNGGHDCANNGIQANNLTIGIEHGGYASSTSWPVGQIDASAKLSCDISKAHAIPRDRFHFVGHGQLQPYNRTDPGANWPWTDYMNRINSHCGVSTTSIIVDSNNANNNAAVAKYEVSAGWSSGTTAGYYGSGYNFASTQAVSDPATFWFYLPAAATRTIDGWWVAGTNRSTTAPFISYNASGAEVGRASANQQINGGQWVALGTYNFSAGWNKVQLSRWTTAGYVVIADAIRVR